MKRREKPVSLSRWFKSDRTSNAILYERFSNSGFRYIRLLGCYLSLLCFLPYTVFAQEGGLAFLRIGTNASAGGMGDTQVANSRDAFSTYWNPAGLAAATSNSAAISYHAWVADMQTYAMATRFRAGQNAGIGLFVTATGSGGLEARVQPGDPDGTFSVQFISTGLSYGRTFGPVRAGVTAKYLSEKVYTETAVGYGFDVGVQAAVVDESVHLGVALLNVGEMNELDAAATKLPRMLRAGVAFSPFNIRMEEDDAMLLRSLLSAEVVHRFPDDKTQLHFGAEAKLLELIALRAGFITNDDLRRFTFGAGFIYEGVHFDYAFLPFESGFEGPGHILTMIYHW